MCTKDIGPRVSVPFVGVFLSETNPLETEEGISTVIQIFHSFKKASVTLIKNRGNKHRN